MSTSNKEPEFIRVEDILDIKPEFQLRDPFAEEEVSILTADLLHEGIDQKREVALTKPIRVYPCREPENAGKFRCIDGQHKLTILRELGVKELEVGKDVSIDYSIDSDEKEVVKIIMGNLTQTHLTWWSKARYSVLLRNRFKWTQQQCADRLFVDRSLVSKWWSMADKMREDFNDPVIAKLTYQLVEEIANGYGVKQFLKPYTEEDKLRAAKGECNAKGEVEVDIGKRLLDRMRPLHELQIPKPDRIRHVIQQTRQNIPLPIVLGSKKYDNSLDGKEKKLRDGVWRFNNMALDLGHSKRLKLVSVDSAGSILEDKTEEVPIPSPQGKAKAPPIIDKSGIRTKFTEEEMKNRLLSNGGGEL